ncbi:MAG: hypothetical protein U0166_00550 [Acidobacteriota bacterium]
MTREDTAFVKEHPNLSCVRSFLELADTVEGSEDPDALGALREALEEMRAVRGGIEDEGCGCIPWRVVPSRAAKSEAEARVQNEPSVSALIFDPESGAVKPPAASSQV